jgi:hypothetical protein
MANIEKMTLGVIYRIPKTMRLKSLLNGCSNFLI